MEKQNKNISEFMFFGIDGDIKNLKRTIKFRRLEKGYSQRDLANITGIKQSAIARLETKDLIPRLDTLLVILRALDLKLNLQRISTGWDKLDSSEEKK